MICLSATLCLYAGKTQRQIAPKSSKYNLTERLSRTRQTGDYYKYFTLYILQLASWQVLTCWVCVDQEREEVTDSTALRVVQVWQNNNENDITKALNIDLRS